MLQSQYNGTATEDSCYQSFGLVLLAFMEKIGIHTEMAECPGSRWGCDQGPFMQECISTWLLCMRLFPVALSWLSVFLTSLMFCHSGISMSGSLLKQIKETVEENLLSSWYRKETLKALDSSHGYFSKKLKTSNWRPKSLKVHTCNMKKNILQSNIYICSSN